MPEPRRRETFRPAGATDRDSRAEKLLVDGLDRYFGGRFEDAIHIWTRVLFLDRGHDRARAYIDRARTALAERQRRADELLEASDELLGQGRTAAARDLLTQAVAASGEDERASALRLRLERLERAHAAARVGAGQRIVDVEPVRGWIWPSRSRAVAGITAVAVLAALLLLAASQATTSWLAWETGTEQLVVGSRPANLPVLSAAEAAMIRARALYVRGRLGEALVALDRIGLDSPQRVAADALRVEIQQRLMAGGPGLAGIIDTNRTGSR